MAYLHPYASQTIFLSNPLKYKRKGLVGTPRSESLCQGRGILRDAGAGVRLAAFLMMP